MLHSRPFLVLVLIRNKSMNAFSDNRKFRLTYTLFNSVMSNCSISLLVNANLKPSTYLTMSSASQSFTGFEVFIFSSITKDFAALSASFKQ